MPFIASRVGVFRVDGLLFLDEAGFDLFEVVGFLADVLDLVDTNVTPLQEANGLFAAGISVCIGTLRFPVIFVFDQNIAVCF